MVYTTLMFIMSQSSNIFPKIWRFNGWQLKKKRLKKTKIYKLDLYNLNLIKYFNC